MQCLSVPRTQCCVLQMKVQRVKRHSSTSGLKMRLCRRMLQACWGVLRGRLLVLHSEGNPASMMLTLLPHSLALP